MITGAVTSAQNIIKSVNRAGLDVVDIILQPLASSEAVLSQEERDLGVAMSNVLQGLATVLDTVLWLYMWVIIARALISWVNPDPWNPIVQFLERVTEPVLAPIRRWVGWKMGIDLSPIIAILIISFLQIAVVKTLSDFAHQMN